MLQIERQEQILALLGSHAALRVGKLAEKLYTSEATVRRDLAALEKKGLVRRVYGGVTLAREELPVDARRQENVAAKEEIARSAAAMVRDGDTVFLDASSTVLHLLPHLMKKQGLTVITNSWRVIEMIQGSNVRIFCVGGHFYPKDLAFAGRIAEENLRGFCPDIAFFSSQGVSEDGDITDHSEEQTALRRVAAEVSCRAVFLCDASKAGKRFLFRLRNVSELDAVVTDGQFPEGFLPKRAN